MDTLMSQSDQKEFQVIARKWRPVSFGDVVAQEHIITTLKNAILHNRIAHAYLFTGSRGVGKTSTARIFARALNCVNGPTTDPCGVCHMCEEIIQGNCMDVMEIDGASNRGIDQIRELRESVKFVPAQGTFKIYIIDEVHMLTKEAFNALLKTLEEPPSHVVFIFATTEPHRMLPTILSRCQRFDFRRISQSKIAEQLMKIAQADNLDVEQKVIEAIAKAGDGSMRDSQSMFDQIISFSGDKILFAQVSQILGVYDIDFFTKLVDFAYNKDISSGISSINKIIREGQDVNHVLNGLLNHYRHLLLIRLLEEKNDVLECTEEELTAYRTQSQIYSPVELEHAIELIADTASKMRFALSKQTSMELLFLKLSRIQSIVSIDQAIATLSELEEKLKSAPQSARQMVNTLNQSSSVPPQPARVPAPAVTQQPETPSNSSIIKDDPEKPLDTLPAENKPQVIEKPLLQDTQPVQAQPAVQDNIQNATPPVEPASVAVNKETIEKSWQKICVLCKNNLLKSMIETITVLDFSDNILTLGMPNNFGVDFLKDKEKLAEVEKLLKQFFNTNIRVKVKLNTNPDIKKNSNNINARPERMEKKTSLDKQEEILNDSKVQMLIDSFSAKVVKLRKE